MVWFKDEEADSTIRTWRRRVMVGIQVVGKIQSKRWVPKGGGKNDGVFQLQRCGFRRNKRIRAGIRRRRKRIGGEPPLLPLWYHMFFSFQRMLWRRCPCNLWRVQWRFSIFGAQLPFPVPLQDDATRLRIGSMVVGKNNKKKMVDLHR